MATEDSRKGSCLCGAVRFEAKGEMTEADACHCTDCRKFSGHFFVSANIKRTNLELEGEEHLTWFALNEKVRRGFCKTCGSSLFWDPLGHDWTAIGLGAFDDPPRTQLVKHIWVSDKPDYYEITDDLPQKAEF